jgi:hypothetical protein
VVSRFGDALRGPALSLVAAALTRDPERIALVVTAGQLPACCVTQAVAVFGAVVFACSPQRHGELSARAGQWSASCGRRALGAGS